MAMTAWTVGNQPKNVTLMSFEVHQKAQNNRIKGKNEVKVSTKKPLPSTSHDLKSLRKLGKEKGIKSWHLLGEEKLREKLKDFLN